MTFILFQQKNICFNGIKVEALKVYSNSKQKNLWSQTTAMSATTQKSKSFMENVHTLNPYFFLDQY